MTSTTKSPKAAKRYTKSEGFRKDHKINWWLTAVVAVFSLTILIPLYFTIVTALKTPAEAGTFSLPTTWEWHNFADAWNYINYPKAALNSAIITVVAVCLTLLTNTFVAYAVARNMDKRFFRFLYYFFLAMMFVPFTVIMLPIAHQMGSLHLDNQLGLMLLYTILGLGTNLFIAIGFIRSIPVSLEEAARVDGASTWRIFRSVTLPLMKPTIVMCLVYCVTGSILAFDQFFILTKGGPNNATMTVVELIYNFAFDSKKDLGMAAALSLIVLVALVIINSIQMRGMRDNTK